VAEDDGGRLFFHCQTVLRFVQIVSYSNFLLFYGLYKPQKKKNLLLFYDLYKPQNRKICFTVLQFVQTVKQ